jgi:hypothetical protein
MSTLKELIFDFGDADLVLDSLGDPNQPLSPRDSARVGALWLGRTQLEAPRDASVRRFAVSAKA